MERDSKIDNIASRLKQISASLEKRKSLVDGYMSTLTKAMEEWNSANTNNTENLTKLRRKFSIVNLLMKRLVIQQIELNSDIEVFEKFVEERTFNGVTEWVNTLRIIDSDMQEIADPEVYGLSPDVPRSFSDILKWTPNGSNKLDKRLLNYLQNLE